MKWGAVVVAAGHGTRFGGPKQFVEMAGLPMVAWSLRTFAQMIEINQLVVVTEPEWIESMQALLAQLDASAATCVVTGGATRQRSVRNGFAALDVSCDAVLIHDGARPLISSTDVRRGMNEVRAGRGAVLAAPVVDTMKIVDPATMVVTQTLDRRTLWAAQTPQCGMRADFERAYIDAQTHGVEATDDVALLERVGVEVVVVRTAEANFKVTLPEDLTRAELLLRERVQ